MEYIRRVYGDVIIESLGMDPIKMQRVVLKEFNDFYELEYFKAGIYKSDDLSKVDNWFRLNNKANGTFCISNKIYKFNQIESVASGYSDRKQGEKGFTRTRKFYK